MILDEEIWMDIWKFKSLRESGTTYAEIARECGVDYRTVKRDPTAGHLRLRLRARRGSGRSRG